MPDERLAIWRGLLFGQRSLTLRLGATLRREFGLTIAQFEALTTLEEAPGGALPMSALAQRLLYSSGSASHLVDRLQERGLLARSIDPSDGRVIMVALTEEGAALVAGARAAHRQALLEEFAPLIAEHEVGPLLDFANRLAAQEGVVPPTAG